MDIIDLTGNSNNNRGSNRGSNRRRRLRRTPSPPAGGGSNGNNDDYFFDNFTMDRMHKRNGYQLNGWWYSREGLREWVRRNPSNPRTRRFLTTAEVRAIEGRPPLPQRRAPPPRNNVGPRYLYIRKDMRNGQKLFRVSKVNGGIRVDKYRQSTFTWIDGDVKRRINLARAVLTRVASPLYVATGNTNIGARWTRLGNGDLSNAQLSPVQFHAMVFAAIDVNVGLRLAPLIIPVVDR